MTGERRGRIPVGQVEPPEIDTSVAHIARVYDYWLGGKDNYRADRAAGEAALQAYPDLASSVRANRAFLGRAVRYLAGGQGYGSSSISAPASRPRATLMRLPKRRLPRPGWCTWTMTRSC